MQAANTLRSWFTMALAVAVEHAAALQALVEEVGIALVAGRQPRVVDFDRRCGAQAPSLPSSRGRGPRGRSGPACRSRYRRRAARRGSSSPPRPRRRRRASVGAHLFEDQLERARGRVEPGAQRAPVGSHVAHRLARDARIHRRLRDRRRHRPDQPRVERRRDDVVRPEASAAARHRRRRPRRARPRAPDRASASAAAIFIASLICDARTSSAPRKM